MFVDVFNSQDPWGCVWITKDDSGNEYVAKSILKVSYEMQALQKVRSLPSPRNIIIPGRLYECEDTYMFLMPCLTRLDHMVEDSKISWVHLLGYFETIIDVRRAPFFMLPRFRSCIQFIEVLHEYNIAYVVSTPFRSWIMIAH